MILNEKLVKSNSINVSKKSLQERLVGDDDAHIVQGRFRIWLPRVSSTYFNECLSVCFERFSLKYTYFAEM